MSNINPKYLLENRMPSQLIDAIVQLLQQNSVSCLWEQTLRCPCVNVQSNSPQPDCPICHGQGWVFTNPNTLDIAITSDKNQAYDGMNVDGYLPSTLATPQITQSGIEDGIKPRDRITIQGWYVPQSYIFNVNQQRLNNGIFLPYVTQEIIRAYIINNNTLVSLNIGTDIALDNNFVKIINSDLLGKTISCVLSIEKRYYVTMLVKDLRYSHQKSAKQKNAATGYGNTYLTYSQLKNGSVQYNGDQVFKMPNQLLLRRETLYFNDTDLVSSATDNSRVISDPIVSSFNSFMSGN